MIDNNLKYCREDLDLTQKELGLIFGVHESTISGWETGKDTIPLNKLVKFCNMYDLSVDYILGLTRNPIKYDKIPKIDKIKIGKKLKDIRKSLNLTQEDIAKETSISQTTYSNYELGLYLVSSFVIYTICKNHKLSADILLGRKKK